MPLRRKDIIARDDDDHGDFRSPQAQLQARFPPFLAKHVSPPDYSPVGAAVDILPQFGLV